MKRLNLIGKRSIIFAFLLILSLSFISAFSFSDFLNKITGKISSSECSGQWIPEYSFCCGGNGESVSKQTSQKNGVSCCWGGEIYKSGAIGLSNGDKRFLCADGVWYAPTEQSGGGSWDFATEVGCTKVSGYDPAVKLFFNFIFLGNKWIVYANQNWKQCRDFQYDSTCPIKNFCTETCPSPKNFGETCLSDCQCRPDTTYCDRNPKDPKNYICLRKKVPFQPCARKEECYSNLCGAGLCGIDPEDACLKYSTESKYMGSPTGCLGREQRDRCYLQGYSYVNAGGTLISGKVCLSKKADGEKCVSASECLSGTCNNNQICGVCSNENCISCEYSACQDLSACSWTLNHCCSKEKYWNSETNNCESKKELGSSCKYNEGCSVGKCVGGKCGEEKDCANWYLDKDGDGDGDQNKIKYDYSDCTAPLPLIADGKSYKYVSNKLDCDDNNPLRHSKTEWYVDRDGDGFGDASDMMMTCSQPAERVMWIKEDCNDDNRNINPSAKEICGNDVDENCDGKIERCMQIKDLSKYSNKEVFLISDKNWKDILSWVSATVWTQQEGDDSNCQRGYGTPENVCVYPTLIWHEDYRSYTTHYKKLGTGMVSGGNYDIDGDIIAYQGEGFKLYLYNLLTNEKEEIGKSVSHKALISNNKVVWSYSNKENMFELYLYDIQTKTKEKILLTKDYFGDLSFLGNYIAWKEGVGEKEVGGKIMTVFDLYLYDISTNTKTRLAEKEVRVTSMTLSGDYVVWSNGDEAANNFYLNVYDIDTKKSTQTQIKVPTPLGGLSISQDKIVWYDSRNGNSDIFLYDILTGKETQITNDPRKDNNPEISGSKIFWIKDKKDIYLYNLLTGQQMQLTDDTITRDYVRISSDNLVLCNGNCEDGLLLYDPSISETKEFQSFDADSIIYFMQQYSPSKVTIVGETPQKLDNLLIAEPELGAGLAEENIQRVSPGDYLSYWKSFDTIVYVEDNYGLSLMASTYASLINAPLIIKGTNADKDEYFTNKNIICVGNADRICNEKYNLEELQKKYVEQTNTDKIILVNPNDLDIKVEEEFQPDKSAGKIYNLYSKTSLVAPLLAGAKHEVIIPIKINTVEEIDKILEERANNLNINKGFLTIFGTPDSIESLFSYQDEKWAEPVTSTAEITKYSVLNEKQDKLVDLFLGRVFGITIADVSAYIYRSIFYDSLMNSNEIINLAGDFSRSIANALAYEKLFKLMGYETSSIINYEGCCPSASAQDYSDKFLIYYDDHANSEWLGLSSIEWPLLKNSFIIGQGCSTCMYRSHKHPDLMCAQALRKGAIGYWGMFEGGGSPNLESMISAIFNNKSLGQVYLSAHPYAQIKMGIIQGEGGSIITDRYVLLGDPTLKLNPPFLFPQSEISKISEDIYEINLRVASIPVKFSHSSIINGKTTDIEVDTNLLIFSTNTRDNSLLVHYAKELVVYYPEFKDEILFAVRVGPVNPQQSYTDIEILDNFEEGKYNKKEIKQEEWIDNEKYLWVLFDNKGLDELPFEISDSGELFDNIKFKFKIK